MKKALFIIGVVVAVLLAVMIVLVYSLRSRTSTQSGKQM
jgi:hypothetical protein